MLREGASRSPAQNNKQTCPQVWRSLTPRDTMICRLPVSDSLWPAAGSQMQTRPTGKDKQFRPRDILGMQKGLSLGLQELDPSGVWKRWRKPRGSLSKPGSAELGPAARHYRSPAPQPATPPSRRPHKSKPLARDWEIVALSCNTLP